VSALTDFEHDLYKDLYYREHERRDKIESSLTFPAGILSLMVGVGAYLARSLAPLSADLWSIVCGVACIVLMTCCGLAGYCLVRVVYPGQLYRHTPRARQIGKYASDLLDYYRASGAQAPEPQVLDELKREMANSFMDHADSNAGNNAVKLAHRYRGFRWLTIALLLLCLASALFSIRSLASPDSTQSNQAAKQGGPR